MMTVSGLDLDDDFLLDDENEQQDNQESLVDENEDTFEQLVNEDLDNEEIQILACYMKVEWLNRAILCWENVKPLYEERDFSQANLLDKFDQMLKTEQKAAAQLEAIYYRSIKRRPFAYRKLAEQS